MVMLLQRSTELEEQREAAVQDGGVGAEKAGNVSSLVGEIVCDCYACTSSLTTV